MKGGGEGTRARMLAHIAIATCYVGSASPRQISSGLS